MCDTDKEATKLNSDAAYLPLPTPPAAVAAEAWAMGGGMDAKNKNGTGDLGAWMLLPSRLRQSITKEFGTFESKQIEPLSESTLTTTHIIIWRIFCRVVKDFDSTNATDRTKWSKILVGTTISAYQWAMTYV